MRMLAGTRNVDAQHFVATVLDQRLDVGNDSFDMRFVKSVLCDEKIYLIESWLFAELGQGGEIDVAVDDILHARLCLAHVENATADHEWLLDPVCGLHYHRVANARSHNLKRVTLDQDLTCRRRPRADFRHEFTDANVAVILDYEQNQVTPLRWARLDLATDRPARFGIAHFRILQDGFDEIVVSRVNTQHGRSRVGCEISMVQFTCQDCV